MEAGHATLLRYRTSTLEQLHHHLHVLGPATLIFFRLDGRAQLVPGRPAVVEVASDDTEQRALLRGQVVSRVEGPPPGVWIEFPGDRLARKLDAKALVARAQRRLGCDLLVGVETRGRSLGRILDLSQGGARLSGISGLSAGVEVSLQLVSPPSGWPDQLGRATVVRAEPGEIAVRFIRSDPKTRTATARLLSLLQEEWSHAPESLHPPTCCQKGVLHEPPVPHQRAGSSR